LSTPERRYGPGTGITLGGIVVILGIVLLLIGWTWIGIIVILLGLLAFGGFARGRWY
jgi:CHASE2 domain-containing sensor protein